MVIPIDDYELDDDWILNTACTFYICPNWDSFSTHKTILKDVVVIENNVPCNIVGIGMKWIMGLLEYLMRWDMFQIWREI